MEPCLFCAQRIREIDYKRADLLARGLKADGTIKARRGSSLCRRHQRQLTIAVRRARIMALLPARPPARVVEWPPRTRKR